MVGTGDYSPMPTIDESKLFPETHASTPTQTQTQTPTSPRRSNSPSLVDHEVFGRIVASLCEDKNLQDLESAISDESVIGLKLNHKEITKIMTDSRAREILTESDVVAIWCCLYLLNDGIQPQLLKFQWLFHNLLRPEAKPFLFRRFLANQDRAAIGMTIQKYKMSYEDLEFFCNVDEADDLLTVFHMTKSLNTEMVRALFAISLSMGKIEICSWLYRNEQIKKALKDPWCQLYHDSV